MQEKPVIIRPALSEDVKQIYNIELKAFPDPWSLDSFISEIEDNDMAFYYVLQINQELVAYMGYWKIIDQAHITNIAVLPEYRGIGIAKKLIKEIFKSAKNNYIKSFTLECRVSNTNAIKLYESCGFESCGIRPKYYLDNGEDALIMWIEL